MAVAGDALLRVYASCGPLADARVVQLPGQRAGDFEAGLVIEERVFLDQVPEQDQLVASIMIGSRQRLGWILDALGVEFF